LSPLATAQVWLNLLVNNLPVWLHHKIEKKKHASLIGLLSNLIALLVFKINSVVARDIESKGQTLNMSNHKPRV
jgi:hypothetical protein